MKKLRNNISIYPYLFLFSCLFSVSTFSFAQTESEQFQDNQILLRFQDFAPQGDIAQMIDELSADIIKYYPLFNAQLWQIADTAYVDNDTLIGVAEVVEHYQDAHFIDYVEPNQFYELQATPNDYNASQLWGLAKIEAPAAWDTRTSSDDVVVGVLDTGIDYNHPDLQANVWTNPNEILNGIDDDGNGYIDDIQGWDFSSDNDGDGNIEGDNDPFDNWSSGHGTHVSGTIGAVGNNGIGITGVNWTTQIMPLKVFSPNNGSSTTAAVLAEAIQYAVMMKVNYGINVQMTNNSWGGGGYSNLIAQAIDASENAGQLFIAAAGNYSNDNDTYAFYPASYANDNIISVASTTSSDQLSSFSNFGATRVDLGAPGSSIYSTLPNNSYGNLSGTSMASPHVTGVVALLWAEHPNWTAAQVKERILCSADPIPALANKCVSEGRLNANRALNIDPPDATFSYTVNGSSVDFVANDMDSETNYSWSFGDGNGSTQAAPTHVYGTPGDYTICLTTQHLCNQAATSCQTVSIEDDDCVGEESWRQYLNSNNVTCLASAGDILFAGTYEGGLIKINTITNETTFYNSANSDLPTNSISALLVTSTGDIFIGTRNNDVWLDFYALAKFDGIRFTEWDIYTTNNSDLPGSVFSLAEDNMGDILVGTNNGLAKFDGIDSNDWDIYDINNSGLPSNYIYNLLVNNTGDIFIGKGSNLTKFDGTNWILYNALNSDLPSNSYITDLLEDDEGNIFIGTNNGLAKFDGTNNYGWTIFNENTSDLVSNNIYRLGKNNDGDIFVTQREYNNGIYDNNLLKFDGSSFNGWTSYTPNNSDLPNKYLSSIIEHQNNIILGFNNTNSHDSNDQIGIMEFDGTNLTGWTAYNTNSSDFSSTFNFASLVSSSNKLFIGTIQGLVCFDSVNPTGWTLYNTLNSDLPDNLVLSLIESSSGEIFVGTRKGLAKFNGINPYGWTIYDSINSDLPYNQINSLLESNSGEIFVGSSMSSSVYEHPTSNNSSSLAKFDGINPYGWTIYTNQNSDLPNNSPIHNLVQSENGEIFMSTWNKLIKFDGINHYGWVIYDHLSGPQIPTLLKSSTGDIFVGTDRGLSKFDGTKWTTYNMNNSDLPHNWIHSLLESNTGDIFVGTLSGLAKFDGTTPTDWTIYNVNNSGTISFGELAGIPYPAFLEQINNEIFIGNWSGIGVLSTTNLTASFSSSSSTCTNSPTTFTNTSQNASSYEWQIDGTTISTDTDLTHTFTETGTYTITLIASNGSDCTESHTETITVHPTAYDLELGNDTLICGTTEFTIQGHIAGMNIYAWDYEDANGNHHYMGDTENITITQSGPYSLVVGDQCNNFAGDTIIVTFADAPMLDLGKDTTVCGGSLTLDAGTWSSYLWSTGETTQTITVTSTGVYSVTITDANGCTASDHIIVTFSSPPALDLGDDIFTCATDTILTVDVAGSYLWSTGETTPSIIVNTTGTYSVTVTNATGCSASDEIDVYLDDNCVWPGDANYDGVVTNIDILYIGLANNTSGIPRPNATINWQAEACENWADDFSNGTNYKHGDTNGDGIITIQEDTTAVGQNYGLTHSGNPASIPNNAPAAIQLTPTLSNCSNASNNGQTYTISLDLNQDNQQDMDLYGIAFSLSYSTELVHHISIDYTNSWLNNDHDGLLTFARRFPSEGRIEFALSRIHQQNINGSGSLVDLEITIDGAPISTNPLAISVDWVEALLQDETRIAVEGESFNENIPFGIDLGADVFSCATDAVLDAGIDDVDYLWSTGETTKTITVNQSGMYGLTITNSYGCSASDEIEVIVNEDCVFPGDVNYDGTVHVSDLIPFGFVQGQTGPERPNASFDWVGQPCQNWGIYSPHTVDTKHADTDGNGIVEEADKQPIFINYARTHANNTATNRLAATAQFTTEIVTMPNQANGGLLEMDIYLSDNGQATPVYGTYFSIDYTAAFGNANILFNESALGTPSTDMYTLHKDFPSDHIMDIGLVRIDLNNAMLSTQQAIARFRAYAIAPNDTSVQMSIYNGFVVDHTANEEAIANETTTPIEVSGTQLTELQLTAILSGAFDPINNNMHTMLREETQGNSEETQSNSKETQNNSEETQGIASLLPARQPFHTAPWNYQGNEGVLQTADLPAGMVDWVLVEIRNEQRQIVTQRAVALLQDGQMVDVVNGLSVDVVALSGLLEGQNYYAILRHRNHIDVMSTLFTVINLAASIDFTQANQIIGGEQQLMDLGNGQYGLIVGDFNGDGVINVKDHNRMMGEMGTNQVYSNCDADLDGHVLTNDFNRYQSNASHIGVGWVRY